MMKLTDKIKQAATMKTFHKYFAFAIVLLISNLFFNNSISGQSWTQTTNGTYSFTVPAGVTSINVTAWGAGGNGANGGNISNFFSGAGGGGGAYVTISSYTVSPGTVYTIVVGNGGGTGGTNNTTINIGATNYFTAAGGGNASGTTAGSAGTSGSSVVPSGGTITAGTVGGGAAFQGNGGNGGAAGGAGGGAGGSGGTSGSHNGGAGSPPGGGGGGGYYNSSSNTGGAGIDGEVDITWIACPTITTTAGYNNPVCAGSTLNLTATNASGGTSPYTYSWTGPSYTSTSQNPSIPSSTTAMNGTYTVTATDHNGCTGSSNVIVTINSLPLASVDAQSNITCFAANDGTITVKAAGGSGLSYMFSVDDGGTWQGPTIGSDKSLFTGLLPNHAYRIRVKDSNGCISK